MNRPLPTIARNNLREAIKFIQAVYPSASDIKFTDAMAGTPAQWYTFQFQNKGACGVATMNALYMDGRICIEHPYTPVLWRYNDEGAS